MVGIGSFSQILPMRGGYGASALLLVSCQVNLLAYLAIAGNWRVVVLVEVWGGKSDQLSADFFDVLASANFLDLHNSRYHFRLKRYYYAM